MFFTRIKHTQVATLAATLIAYGSLAGGAHGGILMTISDDGINLTLRATGSFDVTNATSIGTGSLGTDAAVAPTLNAFGFNAGLDGVRYAASFSGILSGTSDVFPSSSLTTNIPVWVDFDGTESNPSPRFAAPAGELSGTVDETAIFNGTTIASLGLVVGQSVTGTWGSGGVDEQITITVIPEPSSALLLGLGGLGFVVLRRRRTA
ncbi:MAG: PEP-CTERM sorting domain-containing protein [Verrucomicrobiota bacterium]